MICGKGLNGVVLVVSGDEIRGVTFVTVDAKGIYHVVC